MNRRGYHDKVAVASGSTEGVGGTKDILFAFQRRTIRLSGRGEGDIAQTMKNVDNDRDAS